MSRVMTIMVLCQRPLSTFAIPKYISKQLDAARHAETREHVSSPTHSLTLRHQADPTAKAGFSYHLAAHKKPIDVSSLPRAGLLHISVMIFPFFLLFAITLVAASPIPTPNALEVYMLYYRLNSIISGTQRVGTTASSRRPTTVDR